MECSTLAMSPKVVRKIGCIVVYNASGRSAADWLVCALVGQLSARR